MPIEKLKLTTRKLRHEQFLRARTLFDQLELQLADLEENAAQVETSGQMEGAGKVAVTHSNAASPAGRPLPEHLPRQCLMTPPWFLTIIVVTSRAACLLRRTWRVCNLATLRFAFSRLCDRFAIPASALHPQAGCDPRTWCAGLFDRRPVGANKGSNSSKIEAERRAGILAAFAVLLWPKF